MADKRKELQALMDEYVASRIETGDPAHELLAQDLKSLEQAHMRLRTTLAHPFYPDSGFDRRLDRLIICTYFVKMLAHRGNGLQLQMSDIDDALLAEVPRVREQIAARRVLVRARARDEAYAINM